jgi:hypothetical protein
MKFFILFSLVSCSTAQMQVMPTRSQYAPDGDPRTGEVRYLNAGAASIITERRDDAYKQMYMACDGKYRIVGDRPQKTGHGTYLVGNSFQTFSDEWVVIRFECKD